MKTHLFGKTDSPCSSNFALKRRVLDKADILDPPVVTSVDKDFYMDNFLKSNFSIEYLANITNSIASRLKDTGFRFTKFISNSQDIINKLPSVEIASKNL